MREPDNHVSISTGMVHNMDRVLAELEKDGIGPDKVTIQQSDVGDYGEFNLVYDCPAKEETGE